MFIQVNSNGAPFLPSSANQKLDQQGADTHQLQQQQQSLNKTGRQDDDDDADNDENGQSQQQEHHQGQSKQQQSQGGQQHQPPQDDPTQQDGYEDLACAPDDEDLNTTYNCGTCNRVMKGKVMLQAHQYQEHHENPSFEATSFPDNKYACRVCLKLFTRNSDVKAHILRVHCGDRRYPCNLCGKR
jgi:cobalamin biosynthesis protein CobT